MNPARSAVATSRPWNSSMDPGPSRVDRDARLAGGLDVALGSRADVRPHAVRVRRGRRCGSGHAAGRRSGASPRPAARSRARGAAAAADRRSCGRASWVRARRRAQPGSIVMWLSRSWRPTPRQLPRQCPEAARVVRPDGATGRVADAERGRSEPADEQLDTDGAVARIDHDPVGAPAVGCLDGGPAGQLQVAATGRRAHELVPRRGHRCAGGRRRSAGHRWAWPPVWRARHGTTPGRVIAPGRGHGPTARLRLALSPREC